MRVSVDIQIAVEQFLAQEAELLDENRLEEWLDLLADDIRYVMPVRENLEPPIGEASVAAPQSAFALFDDDKESLTLRARRMQSKIAPTEAPAALFQRLIANVRVLPGDHPGEFKVRSTFLIHQERRGRHSSIFVGERHDLLRSKGDSFEIGHREVRLAQTILPATISLFF